MRRRVEKSLDGLFFLACAASTAITLALLFAILGLLASRGAGALSTGFFTEASQGFGAGGGVFYQILGTLLLMTTAGAIALPLAIGAALYRTEYLGPSLRQTADLLIYALNGVPTIIFGLFGYMVFGLWLGLGLSWVTGVLILAVMVLPTMTVSTAEALEAIPGGYREAGLALGLGPWSVIWRVLIPRSMAGIFTGLFLGLARAGGETAAIMFTATAFSGVGFPRSLTEPVATLQTHILVLAGEALNPAARLNAWGAALVLTAVVMGLSLGAMAARRRAGREAGG